MSDPAPELTTDDWSRLSPRMLLVHPVRTLVGLALPLVLVAFGLGDGGIGAFVALGVGALIALLGGVFTWLVTRYRFTEEQLQLRTGLLSRRVLTAPLDRIRSVDIEASPVMRILGLAKVTIGTGVDDSRIDLDGLTRERARQLRVDLLRRAEVPVPARAEDGIGVEDGIGEPDGAPVVPDADGLPGPTARPDELARLDWSWLRYAPFSLSSLVIVAGAAGVISQLDWEPQDIAVVADVWDWFRSIALPLLVTGLVLLVVLGWVLLSTSSYVLNWWNLRVVREPSGTIRMTRGLLTTRSQTIERRRIRGVILGEPFLLRFVRGADLRVIATGVGLTGVVPLLPPAPRRVAQDVGHDLLEETGPLTTDLERHGPRARRRMHVRRQWGTLILLVLLVLLEAFTPLRDLVGIPLWGPGAVVAGVAVLNVLLAESAWRNLGHALTDQHLVVRTGAVIRTREVLERAGIIGWVLRAGFFQRRLGLCDLVATTAAGSERVVAPDIPVRTAVALARRATPGMLDDLVA